MDNNLVVRSIHSNIQNNKLFLELKNVHNIDNDTINSTFEKYYIGTDANLNPVFWQMNNKFYLFNGTIDDKIIWNERERPSGIFGGHLLNEHSTKPIIIVPTPKEAIIFDMYFADKIWIACSTVNRLEQDLPKFAKIRILSHENKNWSTHILNYLKSVKIDASIVNSNITATACLKAGPPELCITKPDFKIYTKEKFKKSIKLDQMYKNVRNDERMMKIINELECKVENIELL